YDLTFHSFSIPGGCVHTQARSLVLHAAISVSDCLFISWSHPPPSLVLRYSSIHTPKLHSTPVFSTVLLENACDSTSPCALRGCCRRTVQFRRRWGPPRS